MTVQPTAFSKSIDSYLNYTRMPWGKLFYSTAWDQLNGQMDQQITPMDPNDTRTSPSILDIGCGFGLSSIEYAARGYRVTGIEPTYEMLEVAKQSAQECGLAINFLLTRLQEVDHNDLCGPYNWVFCHNILEYVDDAESIIHTISRQQQSGGFLSIIAHNPIAKVMKKVIINKDPEEALHSIGNPKEYSHVIQTDIVTYTLEQLIDLLHSSGYELVERYGIHNTYGYIADNECKQNEAWHDKATALELRLSRMSPYRDIAMFTHLIARKRG